MSLPSSVQAAIGAPPQNSFLQDVYTGGCLGLKAGGGTVVFVALTALAFTYVEVASRALGEEPRWPINFQDCQMQQFQNSSHCNAELVFDSSFSFICTAIATTTTLCATTGAVVGAVKHFFG